MKRAVVKLTFGILRIKPKVNFLCSPHFLAIIVITLFLVFIYQAWPWRVWEFDYGIWQWFSWLSSLYKLALVEYMNHVLGILFLVPIIYAAVFFGWLGALIISLLTLAGMMPLMTSMLSINTLLSNIALLLLPFLIISLATFQLEWRRRERDIFASREEERKLYTSKVLLAQESERKRLAQEIHDETIQTLLVIANRAESLLTSDHLNIRELKRKTELIGVMALDTIENLRRISLSLRPCVLDDLGLVSALRWLVDQMNNESSIQTRILLNGVEQKLTAQDEVVIFRVVQEALNNIRLHSKASEAVVTLEFSAECLNVTIEDNGQGFYMPKKLGTLATAGKSGLIGMRERIEFLNGTLKIRSRPSEGTSISIDLNLPTKVSS